MKINEMTALLSGEARTAAAHADAEITSAYAGDMLSDVLALGSQPDVLLTGLLNPQVIRTAEMLDTACVVFLRGKEPEASILELAEKCSGATPAPESRKNRNSPRNERIPREESE